MSALGVWPPKNIDEARKDPYLRALLDHPEWCEGEPVVATRTVDLLNETGSAFDISRRMGWQTETDLQRMFALGVKAAQHVDGDTIPCKACGYGSAGRCPGCLGIRCYTAGEEAGRIEGAERALLERDVRDVAYQLPRMENDAEFSAHYPTEDRLWREVADLKAWLARAKAVLG